ncbi:ubiquitin conjugation factor E4 B-like, partial [Formica exsecta]|uniref:ubiquitin conjugation factor E4 B-like n=1 Tax=Formica exsecta TaxID=72781 RepID=UPI001143FBD9
MSNIEAGYSVVIYNKRKRLDETDTERVLLELNIKRLRNDNEHLKSKLEKKTKNLQIAERNAMIHEKCSCDLQSWANCETLTEIERSKQVKVLLTFKHWMKERDDFANVIISRVLCVSWKSPIEGSIFLPQMAAYIQTQRQLDFSDIIRQALMEVLCMFSRREVPLMAPSPYRFSLILLVENNILSEPKSLIYLLDCYSRIAIEERNHGKQSSVLLIDTLSDVVTVLKVQCVQYSSFVLGGSFSVCNALFKRIFSQNLPLGYLRELVARTHTEYPTMFKKIFTPVLQDLYSAIETSILTDNMPRPIEALGELIEIRSSPNSNIHPICRLITNQVQFLPDVMTSAAGRELSRTSLLGPFLSALVYAEEQPKVLESLYYDFIIYCGILYKPMTLMRQQRLENTRMLLHKMFDTILANSSCRDATLAYLV